MRAAIAATSRSESGVAVARNRLKQSFRLGTGGQILGADEEDRRLFVDRRLFPLLDPGKDRPERVGEFGFQSVVAEAHRLFVSVAVLKRDGAGGEFRPRFYTQFGKQFADVGVGVLGLLVQDLFVEGCRLLKRPVGERHFRAAEKRFDRDGRRHDDGLAQGSGTRTVRVEDLFDRHLGRSAR